MIDIQSLKNLTQHPVVIYAGDDATVTLPACDAPPRASQSAETIGTIGCIVGVRVPVTRLTFGATAGLPDPEPGVGLVVSRIVAESARATGRETQDLLMPSDPVRDDSGRIVGCRGFSVL